MNLNFEHRDKLIRDIKEGEPKFEAKKETLPQTLTDQLSNESIETQTPRSIAVDPSQAHHIALNIYTDPRTCLLLKELVAERLLNKLPLTRMDLGIKGTPEEYNQQYGLTHQHLTELKDGSFLCFDLVQDGEDLALAFTKTNGEKALRPFDDTILAELLDQIQKIAPNSLPEGLLSGIQRN